jgi:glycosyltransferase involved in cell wall biosynthesis
MRILVASAVFPPEPVVSSRLSADLAQHLIREGHAVSVVCPRPSRGVRDDVAGAQACLCMTDCDGQGRAGNGHNDVVRLDSYHCRESRLVGRARESWDFGRKVAAWLRAQGPRYDVVYGNVWPVFASCQITGAAQELGIPSVLHVQDVYPESLATKLPRSLYSFIAMPLLRLDRKAVRRCASVVLLSDRISRSYAQSRRIEDKVRVVRNWVDDSPFLVTHDRRAVCAEYGVAGDRFTYMYLGNLSALSALDTVIKAFAKIARPDRQLVIVGEGSTRGECRKLAQQLGLRNVLFRSEPDAGRVARVQTMADMFVMPTKRGAAITSTPSKCISYMFSGRPILAAVDAESDAGDDIRTADCGWVCEPENLGEIASSMEQAAVLPAAVLATKGGNGRRYAQAHFSREAGVKTLMAVILEAARHTRRMNDAD